MTSADIAALWDGNGLNAGFLAIKPTNFSIDVYDRMRRIADLRSDVDDQTALNYMMKKSHLADGSRVVALDPKK